MHRKLPELPPEIIIQVFKLADSFATAVSLSRISHQFDTIWKTNAHSICSWIIPRVVPYLAQAQELVDTQMRRTAKRASDDTRNERAIQRAKFLLQNKRDAVEASLYCRRQGRRNHIFVSNTYIPAYYQAITVCNLSKRSAEPTRADELPQTPVKLPQEYLDKMSTREFQQVKAVIYYLYLSRWLPLNPVLEPPRVLRERRLEELESIFRGLSEDMRPLPKIYSH